MASVLVVDDSAVDRTLVGKLLGKRPGLTAVEKSTGLTPIFASNGREAIQLMERSTPDLVLTDLQMPEMDGLELVETIKSRFAHVPVILMTAHGSEDTAVQALQRGAASYVPKTNLARDLLETVEDVLAVARGGVNQQRLLESLSTLEAHFILENDPSLIPPLIAHLEDGLRKMRLCDENGLIRIAVALREALINAIHHGNLQVGSDVRERDEKEYQALVEDRRQQEPYQDRRVHVTSKQTRAEVVYVIRDEGNGFDPKTLPDPTDPANLENVTGRGLLLIRTFMDEVFHNDRGNQITMVKRCEI
jgi:CheY-like chemotaxis protein